MIVAGAAWLGVILGARRAGIAKKSLVLLLYPLLSLAIVIAAGEDVLDPWGMSWLWVAAVLGPVIGVRTVLNPSPRDHKPKSRLRAGPARRPVGLSLLARVDARAASGGAARPHPPGRARAARVEPRARPAVRVQPRRARALRPARGGDDERGPEPRLLHQPAGADVPARGVAVGRSTSAASSSGSPTTPAPCSWPGAGSRWSSASAPWRRRTRPGGRGSAAAPGSSRPRSWPSRSCRSSTRGSRSTTGPAMLPCALALWASAIVLRTGSRKALLAGGACVGARRVAEVLRRRDRRRARRRRAAVAGAELQGRRSRASCSPGSIALAVVIVTNPYLFADWATFTHDLDRQRKFAGGARAARPAGAQRLVVLPDVQHGGRSGSCPACWRSPAGSRCWSKAAAARRSCSAR